MLQDKQHNKEQPLNRHQQHQGPGSRSTSSSSTMASLDIAIRLVRQAVHQDSAKNYEEAARCYREAIVNFRIILKSKEVFSPRIKSAVEVKCSEYEKRLRKLERHLLYKADLSKIFKDAVDYNINKSNSDKQSNEPKEDKVLFLGNSTLKKGLDVIERAKKFDSTCELEKALREYERGSGILMEAARWGLITEDQREILRIKCLLVHDRAEGIRNHLDHGAPLQVRKGNLDKLENSLSSDSGSPVPTDKEEDALLLMTEIQSMAGSAHSLYPRCEIKRDEEKSPPLVSLASELNLSSSSLISVTSSSCSSVKKNNNNASRILEADTNEIQVLDENCKTDLAYDEERDRNVSELTYVHNEVIDPDTYKAYILDSGSDSGISDPSDAADGTKSPSNESRKSVAEESSRKSPLSDIDSLDIVPSSPVEVEVEIENEPLISSLTDATMANPMFKRQYSKTLAIPTIPSSSLTTMKKFASADDLVRVISEEHVVDGDVYTVDRRRYEYIPPRAFASHYPDDDADVNKGCYYFMSCLDALGIL